MPGILQDRIVVVTGSAHGGSLGDAIARRVAAHGGVPVVTSRSRDVAEAAAARLRAEGLAEVDALALDLAADQAVERAAEALLARHGRVDGVVHNAGAPITEWARPFLEVPPAEYLRVFDVDVVGAARLTRALLPAMVRRGRGAFVFTSSTAALAGYRYLHEFAPAKAGVLGLTRSVATEFGRVGIRANAVAYGNMRTPPTWDALTHDERELLRLESALERWGEPHEAGEACCFLLSEMASFVNGQTLVVDGGALMR